MYRTNGRGSTIKDQLVEIGHAELTEIIQRHEIRERKMQMQRENVKENLMMRGSQVPMLNANPNFHPMVASTPMERQSSSSILTSENSSQRKFSFKPTNSINSQNNLDVTNQLLEGLDEDSIFGDF